MPQQPDTVRSIVLTCCILHNIMRVRCREEHKNKFDTVDSNGNIVPGEWRLTGVMEDLHHQNPMRGSEAAKKQRLVGEDLFAVSFVAPMLAKHIRSLGASPSLTGIVGSLYGALQLFASPLIGEWSDTSGRRHVLLWTLVLSSVGYLIMGVTATVVLVAVARLPTGIFKHTQELCRTYLADLTPKQEHSQVFGTFNGISSLGFVIGPVIAGHIAQLNGGFHICAILCASIFLLNYALVWLFIPGQQRNKETTAQMKKDSTVNPLGFLKTFKKIEWTHLWDIFLIKFLMGFAVLVYRSTFSMWLDYKFQVATTTIGYLSSLSAIIGTSTGFLVGHIAAFYGNNNSKMLFHAGTVQTLVIISLTFAPSIFFVAALMMPLSIANAIARVASTNLTIERSKGHEMGTLLGLGASVLSIARMVSPTIGGIAQEMHLSGPTIVGGVFAATGVSIMVISKEFRSSLIKVRPDEINTNQKEDKLL